MTTNAKLLPKRKGVIAQVPTVPVAQVPQMTPQILPAPQMIPTVKATVSLDQAVVAAVSQAVAVTVEAAVTVNHFKLKKKKTKELL